MTPIDQERFVRRCLAALETGALIGREEQWFLQRRRVTILALRGRRIARHRTYGCVEPPRTAPGASGHRHREEIGHGFA